MKITNQQPIALPKQEPKPLTKTGKVGALSELEQQKLKLKKATREFESFFTAAMLKSMRQTVPKSEDNEMNLGGGLGKDIFQSMFDEELSRQIASKSDKGLGALLYESLLPRLESQFGTKPDATKSTGGDETTPAASTNGPIDIEKSS